MKTLTNLYIKYIGSQIYVKNFLTYSIISILPITILSLLISYNIEKSLVEKQTVQINLISYNLNNFLEKKYEMFYGLIKQTYSNRSTSPEFFDFIEKDLPRNSQEYYEGKNQFIAYFNNFFTTDNDLHTIVLYKKVDSTTYVLSKTSGENYFSDTTIEKRFKDHLALAKPTLILNPTSAPSYDNGSLVYSISINIKRLGLNTNTGILQLDYSPKGFEDEIHKMSADNLMGDFYVFMPDGKIIYDSSNKYYDGIYPYMDKLKEGTHTFDLDGKEYLINISRENQFGLTVSNVIPKELIFKDSNLIKKQILIITLGCIVVIIFLTQISSSSFSKRINTITSAMKQVRIGNLDTIIKTEAYGDELNTIASDFNEMCIDLSEYIQQVYIYEISKKNAEIEALQAQINPHFIYNTLEAIRMSATSQGNESVSQMILLLAKLFRNIVKEENMVTIETEINNSTLYLDLFQIRYNNKFSYDIQVPQHIRSLGIPKHILQPIIENYMIHGYDLRKPLNQITIVGREENDEVIIEIIDNGLGIDEARLQKINRQMQSPESVGRSNIGLKNVNERIKLIYGKSYGLYIESESFQYTKVICKIASKTVKELNERHSFIKPYDNER